MEVMTAEGVLGSVPGVRMWLYLYVWDHDFMKVFPHHTLQKTGLVPLLEGDCTGRRAESVHVWDHACMSAYVARGRGRSMRSRLLPWLCVPQNELAEGYLCNAL